MASSLRFPAKGLRAIPRAHNTTEISTRLAVVIPGLLASLLAMSAAVVDSVVIDTTIIINFNAILVGFLAVSVLRVSEIYSDNLEDKNQKGGIKDTFYIGIAASVAGIISTIVIVFVGALQIPIPDITRRGVSLSQVAAGSSTFVAYFPFFYFCYLSLAYVGNFYELGKKNLIWGEDSDGT